MGLLLEVYCNSLDYHIRHLLRMLLAHMRVWRDLLQVTYLGIFAWVTGRVGLDDIRSVSYTCTLSLNRGFYLGKIIVFMTFLEAMLTKAYVWCWV